MTSRAAPPLLTLLVAVLLCVLAPLLPASAGPARPVTGRSGPVTCYSVHETFRLGEVFSDENCRRVKCIEFMGEGFVTEEEKCPLPEIPDGANCTMTEPTEQKFPLCCPKAVCRAV